MSEKKRIIMERIVEIKDSNDDWNIKFWQKCGARSRFAAAWEMTVEFCKIRGKNGIKPRLQRDAEHIKRV